MELPEAREHQGASKLHRLVVLRQEAERDLLEAKTLIPVDLLEEKSGDFIRRKTPVTLGLKDSSLIMTLRQECIQFYTTQMTQQRKRAQKLTLTL